MSSLITLVFRTRLGKPPKGLAQSETSISPKWYPKSLWHLITHTPDLTAISLSLSHSTKAIQTSLSSSDRPGEWPILHLLLLLPKCHFLSRLLPNQSTKNYEPGLPLYTCFPPFFSLALRTHYLLCFSWLLCPPEYQLRKRKNFYLFCSGLHS